MLELNFNMAETLAISILVLLLGREIKKRVNFLERFFIPAPVVGGVIFSILLLIGHNTGAFSFSFDNVLKDFLMTIFFTTIGFTASGKLLKKGGVGVVVFLITATVLVIIQDIVGVSMAKMFGEHPLLGLAVGSVPLTGGHGTSGAFGPVLEEFGVTGGLSVSIAAATYGLIAGCLIGGPVAKRLRDKHNLKPSLEDREGTVEDLEENDEKPVSEETLFSAVVVIALSMGIGYCIAPFLKKYGIVIPAYIGPMFIAAIIRNIADMQKKNLPMNEIAITGNIALSLFLAMALMTLKLWELADLAIPIISILLVQTAIMALFAYFITFRFNGKDYDAAVMATGHCGFGLGATPNAMANMEVFTKENGPAPRAFFVLPVVGALFIDFTNATVITFFINMFK
ncbi:sodium/glutamate symporter [uncultured Fusobacterium sp.]|jgi:ESS family glutamate:Na+ symporter|uniref:sodium/glutamate symporter n=1 Tax=uncultured Fusobacterium sp. TaxID=159267 RepID=UPI0025EDEF9E|nr:sodium/glutamate symporter [uncultured Fusobacterium sp.]